MKAIALASALFACGAPHAAAPAPAAPVAARPAPDPHGPALDALMQRVQAQLGLVGVAVAVERDGRPVLERAYGFADAARTRPLAIDDELAIGSLTKQFTAAATMTLVEAGKVALDEPVATYVPAIAAPITVRELLNQTSGLPDFAIADNVGKDRAQILAWIAAAKPAFTPGSTWEYSNTNYWLLSRVIERASGATYDDYLRDHVLAPAGLRATHACRQPERVEPTVVLLGKAILGGAVDLRFYDGAGALCSTIGDLVRWQAALFGGKVVRAASLAFMTTPPRLSPLPTHYGAGLMADHEGAHPLVWHNGAVPGGFESELWVLPDDHAAIVVLTNTAHDEPGTTHAIASALADVLLAPDPQDLPIDRARRDALVGTYQLGAALLVVRADGDGLAMKAPAGEGRLLYQGGDRLVLAWNHAIELRITGGDLEVWQLGAKLGTATRAP